MTVRRAVKARRLADQLARYLSAPYVRMIIPNSEEGGYLAEVLELPGCISEGETPEEAYRNLEDAMTGWIAASLDTNRPIPDAVGDREYSGHFPLRMSTELHRVAALRAMQEGVSLNQWIAGAIAEKVTKEDLADMLADKIASKVAERMSFTALFGMQYGTRETSKETTTAKVELSDPGTTMMRADNVTSLAAGASGKVRILEWSKEAKQNA